MNDQNLKNLCLKVFYFSKILKMRKKYNGIRKLFCFCFILYKEKMLTDKAKVKSLDRRAQSAVNFKHTYTLFVRVSACVQ